VHEAIRIYTHERTTCTEDSSLRYPPSIVAPRLAREAATPGLAGRRGACA